MAGARAAAAAEVQAEAPARETFASAMEGARAAAAAAAEGARRRRRPNTRRPWSDHATPTRRRGFGGSRSSPTWHQIRIRWEVRRRMRRRWPRPFLAQGQRPSRSAHALVAAAPRPGHHLLLLLLLLRCRRSRRPLRCRRGRRCCLIARERESQVPWLSLPRPANVGRTVGAGLQLQPASARLGAPR